MFLDASKPMITKNCFSLIPYIYYLALFDGAFWIHYSEKSSCHFYLMVYIHKYTSPDVVQNMSSHSGTPDSKYCYNQTHDTETDLKNADAYLELYVLSIAFCCSDLFFLWVYILQCVEFSIGKFCR